MNLDDLLRSRRDQILQIAAKHGALNVRVFGSVARGEAKPQSDIDLLVEFRRGTTLLHHAALIEELEALLGVKVECGQRTRPARELEIVYRMRRWPFEGYWEVDPWNEYRQAPQPTPLPVLNIFYNFYMLFNQAK